MGISIIIPLYNKAPYLEATLESLVHQLEKDDELLVVDDGSTDDSLTIASKFVSQRIRIIKTPHNVGPGAARNLGAQNASGIHLLFFDADDLAHPDLLMAVRSAITLFPEDALYCYRIAHQSRGEGMDSCSRQEGGFLKIKRLDPHAFVRSCLAGHPLCTASSTCVTAEAFRSAGGFHPDLRFGEDPELWARLSADYPTIFIDSTLAFYREVLSGASFGYRAVPGSVEPYVNTLFKLAQNGQEIYHQLAFSVTMRNAIFSLASGCGRKQLRERMTRLERRFTVFRKFQLQTISYVPGRIFKILLACRTFLLKLRVR